MTLNVDEYIGSKKFSIELQVNDGDIFSEKKRGGDRLCIDCNWSYAKCFLRFTENVQWVNLSFVKTSKFTLLVCFVLFFLTLLVRIGNIVNTQHRGLMIANLYFPKCFSVDFVTWYLIRMNVWQIMRSCTKMTMPGIFFPCRVHNYRNLWYSFNSVPGKINLVYFIYLHMLKDNSVTGKITLI